MDRLRQQDEPHRIPVTPCAGPVTEGNRPALSSLRAWPAREWRTFRRADDLRQPVAAVEQVRDVVDLLAAPYFELAVFGEDVAYLRELQQELQACLHHPEWLIGKLENVGPAGLEADLNLCDDPLSRALGTAVRQNAHVLGPLQCPGSLAATLATRFPGEGPTKVIGDQLIVGLTTSHLRAITALPGWVSALVPA